ncbi:hypothetical protein J7E79_26625 [Bacillus sp. ISL-40]|uniref:hypothetical protein n=1 Tax=Bacillus sp. ISL-40 TaxID=2819126 RepID=UPI001BEC6838|nr:hypothetical protein [Bacillus sp. ISL-40]MBT2700897.1 hypothetical protein [Bacillus sp. ISL-40]
MERTADYTIQGFIYQFNKTLLEILNDKDDSMISIEGIVEDIEVKTPLVTKAIQCKYHEASEKFQLSTIYKPILQMMDHYYENAASRIEYRLYAHFPSENYGSEIKLTEEQIKKIFESTDKKYGKLIEKLKGKVDITLFLEKFTLEFGLPLTNLIEDVKEALSSNDLQKDSIDELFYPNAIQIIADLSIIHDSDQRKIKNSTLIKNLLHIRKTAVTRWTRSLKTLDIILKTKKKQLNSNLAKNSRLRYFLISESSVDDFDEEIVTFITDYLNKFHFKEIHDKTPVFCLDCSEEIFHSIRIRLHKKNIKFNDGLVTDIFFDKNKFLIDPVRAKIGKSLYLEFSLKLKRYDNNILEILNEHKCDDFFVFMENVPEELDLQDINLEQVDLNDIKKIRYIMGMSESYE